VLMLNPFGSGVFPYVRKVISEQSGADPQDVRKAITAEAVKRQMQGEMVAAYDWDDIIRVVSASFGVRWTESIATLVEHYCEPPHIKLYPGVVELLTTLSEADHTLRALTNGFHIYQYPVLKALGIAHFFERIITPEQVGYAKPDQAFYAAARADAPLPHIHIGDNVIHDVWGANRSGAVSIWVHNDLPEGWQKKTPLERATDPSISQVVQAGIDGDLCPHCHPELTLSEAMPRFVVGHLSEVNEILPLLVQAS
ncbi:MAG: HAD-IA family hydrolase, partial [Firmicutes bacterium]|nr:HAD-IA family hydrolase [Bacillota bacterium]